MRLFFKFSWTCWILSLASCVLWDALITPLNTLMMTIIICALPLLGIFVTLIVYLNLKGTYRRVVQEVNKNNYLSYSDVEFNQNFAFENFKEYPIYLEEVFSKHMDKQKSQGCCR
jgi:hypothetical protein